MSHMRRHRELPKAALNCEFDDNLLLPRSMASATSTFSASNGSSAFRSSRAATASQYQARPLPPRPPIWRLSQLYDRLERGQEVDLPAVEAAIRLAEAEIGDKSLELWREDAAFRTRKRRITPRSPGQAAYIKAVRDNELVFGLGPAGTGKTYIAVAAAVDLLMSGRVERLILSRPAVEAGERLGFFAGRSARQSRSVSTADLRRAQRHVARRPARKTLRHR